MRELFKINFIVSFLFVSTGFGQENNVVIGIPEANTLYRGYTNIIQIGFLTKIKDFSVKCQGCDTIYQRNLEKNEYVVIPKSKSRELYIEVYKGKKQRTIISSYVFKTFPLPEPTLYIDGSKSKEALRFLPSKIFVKYDYTTYLKATFSVTKWEIKIGEKIFFGTGNLISDEVNEALIKNEDNVEVFDLTVFYVGPDHVNRIFQDYFRIVNMKPEKYFIEIIKN